MNTIESTVGFDEAIDRGPYAWPGGYPLYFVTSDGAALSFDAAAENAEYIRDSIETSADDGWRVVAVAVNWEGAELYCDHSGGRIPSAYDKE